MISLFRKIRHKLLSEGSLSKYLVYATGEIILVVIGILIALQINNWNEERKDRELEAKLKSELKSEFERDLIQLDSKIEIRKRIIKSSLKLLDYIDHGDVTDNDSIRHYMAFSSFRPTFDPISVEMIDKSDISLIANDTLRRLLTSWKIDVWQLREDELNWQKYVTNQKYAYELSAPRGLARNLQIEFWKDKGANLFLLEKDSVQRSGLRKSDEQINFYDELQSSFWDTYCTRAVQLNDDANLNSEVLRKRILDIMELLKLETK